MSTHVDQSTAIAALRAVWTTIDELVTPLTDEQWAAPSGLPGWSVGDVVAHIVGTESMLDGREPDAGPEVAGRDHVRNPIGELNERWIDHYRSRTRAELMDDYRSVTAKRLADLEAMDTDAWAAETATPVGPESYGRFMRVRVYDCWVHEVDIRDALGLGEPTDEAVAHLALDEFAEAFGFIVGKRARARNGATVTFDFTGLVAKRFHVAVADRAAVVPAIEGSADVTLTTSVVDYARLAGGRPRADVSSVQISGDVALGTAIVDNLHYMI